MWLRRLLISSLVLGHTASYAAANWYGGATLGTGITRANSTQTLLFDDGVPNPPKVINRYVTNGHTSNTLLYGIYGGKYIEAGERGKAGLGLEADLIRHNHLTGRAYTAVNSPAAEVLNFSYAASSYVVSAKANYVRELTHRWAMTIGANLGASSNHGSDYSETVVSDGAVPAAPFRSHSVTKLAYGLGLGVSYQLSAHSELAIEARYLNVGSARFRTSTDQHNGTALKTKSLDAKLLSVSLSFM